MNSLKIRLKYKSFENDILNEFYIPVLKKSTQYYRAVGYFSSNILKEYITGLIPFAKNGGEIRLIISPYITENDLHELQNNYDNPEENTKLDLMFESFLYQDEKTIAASKLFIMLIRKGVLKVKVAEPLNVQGLFHEKIGVFIDDKANMIAINGSNNETGSAIKLNQESFNTFCSWKIGQEDYVIEHLNDFNNYWNGHNNSIKLKTIQEALKEDIFKKFYTEESIEDLVNIIKEEDSQKEIESRYGFSPYRHQLEAVDIWMKLRRGILKFATGSGKTITAIMIMEELKKMHKKKFFIIVVPDKTLVNQWALEVEAFENKVIKCSSSYEWEKELTNIIDIFDLYEERYQNVIVTNDTFYSTKFQKLFNKINDDFFLIVDECHTWGTDRILNMLPETNNLLGLSATPEVFFSKDKTERLLSYFGGIIHEYSLKDAIVEKRLVEYLYKPIFVGLNEDEKLRYEELTRKIVKIIGYDIEDVSGEYGKAAEMLLFKRAKIIYGAREKLNTLEGFIDSLMEKGRLLIYCGPTSYSVEQEDEFSEVSLTQLQEVNNVLAKKGVKFAQYTSKENEYERKFAIEQFKNDTYSTLVAIKCLDEGVNIPQIERAVIMASSTNPREFIQRRGRILRNFPGKTQAEIYDFIVYDQEYPSLIKKEIERLYEFASIAKNSQEILEEYKSIIEKIKIRER